MRGQRLPHMFVLNRAEPEARAHSEEKGPIV